MASLYPRKGSPYFWLKFRNELGKVTQISTGCRIGSGPDTRRAKQMEAQKNVEELSYGEIRNTSKGWAWVSDYLNIRYAANHLSNQRYLSAWTSIEMFIQEKKIPSPASFTRAHCFQYVTWRQKPDREKGKYKACLNTVLTEIKVLRIILQEAVERGMCPGNPCIKLGIKAGKPKQKPELTAEHCATIRAEIRKVEDSYERQLLRTSFEIARHQGCRLKETQINPMTDVDITGRRIRFKVKGGKEHIAPLHPNLVPLFEELQSEGRTTTWCVPPNRPQKWAGTWAGNVWFRFLTRIGLKKDNITFHSTRVTVATEFVRKNVPEAKAMKYLGHASTTVHRIYQRLRLDDLSDCVDAIGD